MKYTSLLLASALVALPAHAEKIPIFEPEYQTLGSLDSVGVRYAYDNEWTGKGVTIGVIDDGVDPGKPEFAGRVSSISSRDFGSIYYKDENGREVSRLRNDIADSFSTHGPLVMSVLAGNAQGLGSMGIAPQVQVAMFRIDDYYVETKQKSLAIWPQIFALEYAVNQRVKVVNRSYSMFSPVVEFTRAMNEFAKSGSLLINSAGNYSGYSPMDSHSVTPENRNSWLFVGAVEERNGLIVPTSYTNLAGSMADRYMVAFGNLTIGVVDDSLNVTERDIKGTSFSAPMVTGAAALILQKWPDLSGQQVGEILLTTARDLGSPGVDEVYGHGLLDIQAALSPIAPRLSNGTKVTATFVASQVGTGGIEAAMKDVVILDKYGRDYVADLSGIVYKDQGGRRFRDLFNPTQIGDFNLGYDPVVGQFVDSPTVIGYKGLRVYPGAGIGFQTKNVGLTILRDDTVFGAKSDGSLSLGKSSTTVLVNGSKLIRTKDVSIQMSGAVGVTKTNESRNSLIRSISPLITSSWHVDVSKEFVGGRATIGLGQPLVIESGKAKIKKAVSYDSGELNVATERVSLKSDRRPLELRAGVESDVFSLSIRQDISGSKDTTVFLRFSEKF